MDAHDAAQLWRAIREVEVYGATTLRLRGLDTLQTLPAKVLALKTVEVLHISDCPTFELPETLDGLPALRRLELRDGPARALPPWAGRLELALTWGQWWVAQDTLSPSQLRGLYVYGGGYSETFGQARWPDAPLDTLELSRVDPPTRDAILRCVALHSVETLTTLRLNRGVGCPAEVAAFGRLQTLDVAGSNARRVPVDLAALSGLEWFGWQDGVLTEPPDVAYWPRLRALRLNGNALGSLPAATGRLAHLEQLDVSGNRLTTLPEALADHPRLARVSCAGNLLSTLPPWLFRLPQLAHLDVKGYRGERLQPQWTIPPDILGADKLTRFSADPTAFVTPPPEVVAKGLDAIKTYWRQRTEGTTDYLSEAKLLIIGEPGAGKTTLARKLRDRDAAPPADGESTEGIDVHRWGIDGHIRLDGKTTARYIDVNIWDFGGQEIYHATHQFFLSRRSVYVLVTDCRREDTDFHYWLRAAELFGGDSPVVVVLNERHGRTREIDADRWRGRFPALAEVVKADLSTPEGADTVRAAIERQILGLDHLADALPKRWRDVREALEARREAGEAHITLAAYLALCAEHGFEARADKLVLSGYLHDLGVCLHFQDGGLLERTVILDPEWGTDAVYRVLDHRPIVDAYGRFTRAQLAEVWTEAHYEGMHGELLALMQRFELCYPLPGGTTYIAPQLLSRERPSYRLPAAPGITLRYRYAFMPKGIVTRFIVATHDMHADQGKVWRSGVVLRRGETWCEVVEDYPAREVTVRVVGDDRAGLLGIVDRELERIHASFERKLRYDTWVPCDCDRCADGTTPHLFAYARLRKYADARKSVTCDESFAEVDAARLLDRALPERRVDERARREQPLGGLPRARAVDEAKAAGEVFVSYADDCAASRALVERVHAGCVGAGIAVQRDAESARAAGSFAAFSARLGEGRCVVLVLSGASFRSRQCMHELMILADAHGARRRVVVLHAEPHVCDVKAMLRYTMHWEAQVAELGEMIKGVQQASVGWARDEIELLARIRDRLPALHRWVAEVPPLGAAVRGDGALDGLVAALRAAMD